MGMGLGVEETSLSPPSTPLHPTDMGCSLCASPLCCSIRDAKPHPGMGRGVLASSKVTCAPAGEWYKISFACFTRDPTGVAEILSRSPPAAPTGAKWFGFARWRLSQPLGLLQAVQRPSLRLGWRQGWGGTQCSVLRNRWRWCLVLSARAASLSCPCSLQSPINFHQQVEGGRGREG